MRIARTLVRALLIGTVSVGIVVPASVVWAAPSPGDVQRQIDDASNNLEKIVEQYNHVTEDLKATTAAQAALAAQMGPLQASMDEAYSAVQDIAVRAFKGAPVSTGAALLEAGSPTELLDQLGTLDQIGRQRRTEIAGYQQAKSKYDGQKKQLDATQAAQTAQQQQLDAQKTKINSDLQALYALRTKAYGSPTEPVPAKSNAAPPAVAGSAGVAVRYAYSALGVPYVWAGESMSGFDCSGLTKAAWGAAGRSLPHNAAMQWSAVAHIGRGDLKEGDLVFYNGLGHVGLYVGGNQIIHAPHAGTSVQLASVDIMRPYGYGRVR